MQSNIYNKYPLFYYLIQKIKSDKTTIKKTEIPFYIPTQLEPPK